MTSEIKAIALKCEWSDRPLGIDTVAPRLSWVAQQGGRDCRQSAYRVVVGTVRELVARGQGDMWDSGFVRGNQCANIVYNGAPLQSSTRYYFSVQLMDKSENKGQISEVSYFETALLSQQEWEGCWIGMPCTGPAQLIRKEFTAEKEIAWARAYVAGLGYYELHINGRRIGDRVLEPGFTDYTKRVFYSTYDVTDALVKGENCVGVHLGTGWHKHPCFILQLNIQFTDGTQQSVYTEPAKWDMFISPITNTNIYMGENYDSRFEVTGWDTVSPDLIDRFPRQHWKVYANLMPSPFGEENPIYANVYHRSFICLESEAPGGRLEAQPIEPIRVVRTTSPVTLTSPKEGIYVADFGENIAGWVRFTMDSQGDDFLVLRHSEILFEDGTINQSYLKAAELYGSGATMQTEHYRTAAGLRTYEPKFTYHGFRFVQIEGCKTPPKPEDIVACVVHSDVTQRGFFKCSNALVNTLQDNILRTEKDNLHSIPTDCPQRDERMGWLNDMTARYEEAIYNFDMVHIYEKWAQDISDAQDPISGSIPDTAPLRRGQRPADPCTVSYLLVSDGLLNHCGDTRTVERQYENYKKWVNYLHRQSLDGILTYSYWGDWAAPKDYTTRQFCDAISAITPGELISTGYLYYNLRLMEKYANVLNKTEQAADFAARAEYIKTAFNREFFNSEAGSYSTGSQACNVFPLFLGLVPQGREQEVAAALNADVIAHDYHLTTGNLCTKYLLEQLAAYGYIDTAFRLLTQTTYPSWGYMIEMGATTIWERWEYATSQGMNSHNHPMYASVSAFFYKHLAGITVADASGFDRFTVKPYIPTDLDHAQAALNTVRGKVFSGWEKKDSGVLYTIEVPVGSQAECFLPFNGQSITESGKDLQEVEGVTVCGTKADRIHMRLGSGEYSFFIA